MSGREDDYPLPSHAASIWLTGEALFLALPGTNGARGHTVRIPRGRCEAPGDIAALSGWSVLLELLRQRMHAAEEGTRASIGTRAAPVQYDIDGMLRSLGKRSVPKYDSSGRPNSCDAEDLGL